jgi:hypothetical protein
MLFNTPRQQQWQNERILCCFIQRHFRIFEGGKKILRAAAAAASKQEATKMKKKLEICKSN